MIDEVRRLEGWMTFSDAAQMLGMTNQGMHRLVFNSAVQRFDVDRDVRAVGDRPLMIVRTVAVEAELQRRQAIADVVPGSEPGEESPRAERRKRIVG